jgi:TonB family protein
MRPRRLSLRLPIVTLAALLLGGSPLAAQGELGNTWLRWSASDVFVAADTVRGVGLWLVPRLPAGVVPAARMIDGDYYEPEQVLSWLRSADSVLHARQRAADDARTKVITPLLPSLAGNGGAFLFRTREENRRDRNPTLALADSVGHLRLAFSIGAGDDDATDAFFDALRKAAQAVGHRHPTASEIARDVRCTQESRLPSSGAVPAQLVQIPEPEYPWQLDLLSLDGRVLLSYVVDTTGRADTSSIVVRFANHYAFVEPATAAIRKATFIPAAIAGKPVRQCVQRMLIFHVGR